MKPTLTAAIRAVQPKSFNRPSIEADIWLNGFESCRAAILQAVENSQPATERIIGDGKAVLRPGVWAWYQFGNLSGAIIVSKETVSDPLLTYQRIGDLPRGE
jgi:hypothetical protein